LHIVILSQLGEIAKLLVVFPCFPAIEFNHLYLAWGQKVGNVVFSHFSLLLSSWQFLCLMQTRSLHRMKRLLRPFVSAAVVGNVA
jgi:hypothetical protein